MTPSLSLFGTPSIALDGSVQPLPFERRTQLLVHLALRDGWVARDELAALLWPAQDTRLAQTNLRKALFRLQGLHGASALLTQGRSLRLQLATDVRAFEAALDEQRLPQALALRTGELLAGFDDDANDAWSSWLASERRRLRSAWRGALQQHLQGELPAAEAVERALQLLADDPLDESALRLAMQWHARAGLVPQARSLYREFAERLADELGLAPSAEFKALHDSLGTAALPASSPSVAPPVADGLVGRTVEQRRLAALLADPSCRLLTILGPGGVGKTSLARHAAQALAPQFADGVVFVALEDVASPEELVARLAHELDAKPAGHAAALQAVIAAVGGRRMLLVLDNFEQLLAAAPTLAALLAGCAALKIMVTSRVRLALGAEWLFTLDGLPYPDEEDADQLESFDATRLFLRAARRVAPALSAPAEAAAIVEICRQVEGLPLAIELAASWARVLSCAEIAAELRRGTELLQTVDPAHPPRHASIEIVFDQSWRLLAEAERQALARLSVFRGGFTADAARAVAGASLAVLAALVDGSLLRREGPRLVMHPLVHQFAHDRLDEAVRASTRATHASFFLDRLAQQQQEITRGDRETLQAIDLDIDNLRAAWLWAIAQPGAGEPRRCAKSLLDVYDHRDRHAESLALFTQALASPAARAQPGLRVLLRSQVAQVLYRLDRYDEAVDEARRALEAMGPDDQEARRQAYNVLATCALRMGCLDDARGYFLRVLDSTPTETHARVLAQTLDHLALVEKGLGHYDEATRLALQALVQHRQLGNVAAEALCLSNLGSISLTRRDYPSARQYLDEALALCEREGIVNQIQYVLVNLAEVAGRTGDLPAAARYAQRALEAATATGHRALMCGAYCHQAQIAAWGGDVVAGRSALAQGASIAMQLGPAMKMVVLAAFAELLHAEGRTDCARRVLIFAAAQPQVTPGDRAEVQLVLQQMQADEPDQPPLTGISMDEMVQRIAAETALAHAPLIAALRG